MMVVVMVMIRKAWAERCRNHQPLDMLDKHGETMVKEKQETIQTIPNYQ